MLLKNKNNISLFWPITIAIIVLLVLLLLKNFIFVAHAGMVNEPGSNSYTYNWDKEKIHVKDITEETYMIVLKSKDGKIVKYHNGDDLRKYILQKDAQDVIIDTDFGIGEFVGDYYIGFVSKTWNLESNIIIPVGQEIAGNIETIDCEIENNKIGIDFNKITIYYDNIRPVIKNVKQDFDNENNTVKITIDAEENYGIEKFNFYKDVFGEDYHSNFLFSSDKAEVELKNNNKFVVVAEDLASNLSYEFKFEVNMIDNAPPIIDRVERKENGETYIHPNKKVYQNVDFIINAHDDNMDKMQYGMYYVEDKNIMIAPDTSDSLFSYQSDNTFKAKNNGKYVFRVKDRYGNISGQIEHIVENIDSGLGLSFYALVPAVKNQPFTSAEVLNVYFEVSGDHANSSTEVLKAEFNGDELEVYDVREEEAEKIEDKDTAYSQEIAKSNNLHKIIIDNTGRKSYKGILKVSVSEDNGNYKKEDTKEIVYDALAPILSEVTTQISSNENTTVTTTTALNYNWINDRTVVYRFKAVDPSESVADEEVFQAFLDEIKTTIVTDAKTTKTTTTVSETMEKPKKYLDDKSGEVYSIPLEKWEELEGKLIAEKNELVSGFGANQFIIKITKKDNNPNNEISYNCNYISKDDLYEVTFSVPQNSYANITADICLVDQAGWKSNVISKDVMIDTEKPKINSVRFVLTDALGNEKYSGTADKSVNKNISKGFAKDGDVLSVTIEAEDNACGFKSSQKKYLYFDPVVYDKAVELSEEISEDGKRSTLSQTFTFKNSKIAWEDGEEIHSFEIDDNFRFDINKIYVKDALKNTCDADRYYSNIVYYAPLEFEEMDFRFNVSRNGVSKKEEENSKLIANEGDTVAFSFTTNHEIIINDDIKDGISICIGSEDIKCDPKYENGACKGSFVVKDLNKHDNKRFKLSCNIKDKAGNVLTIDGEEIGKSTVDTNITYYSPIEDCIKKVSLSTSNTSGMYTKDGDVIYVDIEASHPLSITNGEIARNKGTEKIDIDNNSDIYCLEYTLKNGDLSDNEEVPFMLEIDDASDNETYKCTNVYNDVHYDNSKFEMLSINGYHNEQKRNDVHYVETDKIIYFAPIDIRDLKMDSTNENPEAHAVKNGDRITFRFSSNHEVDVNDMLISKQEVSLNTENNKAWECSIDITEGFAEDRSKITISGNLTDKAGNTPYKLSEAGFDNSVYYYAPVKISDVTVVSSNNNDGTKYAKNGDIIKLLFIANHEVTFSPALLCENTPQIKDVSEDDNVKKYEFEYTLKDQDIKDQSVVKFSFEASDIAGNKTENITNDLFEEMNQITYYAPIVSETSLMSGNRNNMYVNNGGRIIVSGKANHSVIPDSALINGREASVSGSNSESYTFYYNIDNNEKSMPEGAVSFSYTLTDKAGNTASVNEVNDNTTVIYDRTLPVITSEFDNVSFSNHSITFRFTFSDDHISPQDISVKINGEEQVSDAERNSITGSYFTKEITLSTDNNYHIVVNTKDLADNDAVSGFDKRVTVDTTEPEIRTLNISADRPEIYKSEFDIRDHFDFYDKNLKEVICTVTNSNGSREWNINEPIVSDGKNTIYIMLSDMADNNSRAFLYDFYIDGTAPKPVISEILSNEFLLPYENKVFSMEADLKISLEALHIDNISQPDKFEKLYIVDQNDEMVIDLLNSPQSNPDFFTVSLKKPGNYTLCVEAKDSVDNSTGLLKYPFIIKSKSIADRFWDNKLALTIALTGSVLLFFVVMYVLIFKRVRKSRQEWYY